MIPVPAAVVKNTKNAVRMLEEPSDEQAETMRAFGGKIAGGVLQEI